MSLPEIKYLLTDAGKTLDFIYKSYEESLDKPEVSIALRIKIKHFLEDVKSSLDYMGYHIFTNYCTQELSQKKYEELVGWVYFPNKKYKDPFDTYIKKYYPNLKETYPDIVDIFESVQPFTETKWYSNLNELVNKNKYRHLTKQQRNQTTHVHYGQIGGVTLENVSFVNCGVPISYNDTPIDFVKPSPYDNQFIADATIEFIFKDLNLSVIPTLNEIYTGANTVIKNIEKHL